MPLTTDTTKAREALHALLRRIERNIANDRLVAALIAAAEGRARARMRR